MLKKYFPLCFVEHDILLLYKNGSLYLFNIKEQRVLKSRKVVKSFKENWVARINLLFRVFRIGARSGLYIGNDTALIVIGQIIYEVNTKTLELSFGYTNGESRPLKFGVSEDVKGFDDTIYWGEYMCNPNKNEVSIYKRIGVDKWEKVYKFMKEEVNHIHNVVPDKYNDCVWIFTGDFDDATAIWRATDNFRHVEPIFRGKQIYRGCVIFPSPEGLLYATDAPFAENFICKLYKDNGVWKVEKLMPINGSCIFGTHLNRKTFVFQTTVEPDGRDNSNKLVFLFGRKRGSGIKDNYVYLYAGNSEDGFNVVYRAKKDNWPYIAFQFGTFQFPDGMNEGNLLPFYSMAVKKHNLETQIIDITDDFKDKSHKI